MFVCWEVEDEVEVSLERVLHFREQKEEYRILGVGVVDLEMQVALVNWRLEYERAPYIQFFSPWY
jgi:hypothetical protein